MKPVRAITVVTLGPAVLGVALGVGAWFASPEFRNLSEIAWATLCGIAGGLAFFGPIAAVLALKARHPDWLLRHLFRLHFCISAAMSMALGYFAACIRHGAFDAISLASMGIVGLGAALKIGLSDAQQNDSNRIG